MKASKFMWCALVIAVIVACATFIYMRISAGTKHEPKYQTSKHYFSSPETLIEEECISVCESKECIYQSKVLLDHINPDVNPCEDFHHFACGRNFEKYDESESYSKSDRFGNELFTKVKHVLDGIEAEPGSASEKLKAVYDSCMAYSSNEFQAVPTVLKLLDNLGIPNWPNLAPDFNFTNNFTSVIANFLLYKEYAFIEFSTKSQYIWMKENSIVDVKANASLKWTKSFYDKRDSSTRKYLVNRILNYFKLDDKTVSAIWEDLEAIHDAVIHLKQKSVVMDEGTEGLLDCSEGAEKDWVSDIKLQFDHFFEMLPNETKVNNFYELIQYHPTNVSFLNNVFEHKKSMKIIELKGLFQTDESYWIEFLFTVQAFAFSNKIEICFGLMVPPSYVPGGERIQNMLVLGAIIIHEVGHNLQDFLVENMAEFDPEGNEYYQSKMKCLEDQYSQFEIESIGKTLDGRRYLKENFADTVIISVLDKLIEKYASLNTTRLLPALSYSLRQQMYIYSAQVATLLSCLTDTKDFQFLYSFHSNLYLLEAIHVIRNCAKFQRIFRSFWMPSWKLLESNNKMHSFGMIQIIYICQKYMLSIF